MKQYLLMAAAAGIALTVLASAAWAGHGSPGIDRRQAIQHERIAQGSASGELTMHEQRSLNREQAKISRTEQRMGADGCLNMRERARLHRMQDRAGRHIYRAKHNGQTTHE